MRYAFWLIAVCAVGADYSATRPPETLTGHVVATHTGTPLPGATVRVDGVAREARTDSTGGFVLPGVPSGRVTVRARRLGFYPGAGTVGLDGTLPRRVEVGLDPVLTCLDACTTEPPPTPGYVRAIR